MAQPRAGIVLGSSSDEEKAQAAAVMLEKFGVPYDLELLSAHRSPRLVADYAASAEDRGLEVIIAAAGRSAALPGMIAAHTILPVIGLPIYTPHLGGADALHSGCCPCGYTPPTWAAPTPSTRSSRCRPACRWPPSAWTRPPTPASWPCRSSPSAIRPCASSSPTSRTRSARASGCSVGQPGDTLSSPSPGWPSPGPWKKGRS